MRRWGRRSDRQEREREREREGLLESGILWDVIAELVAGVD